MYNFLREFTVEGGATKVYDDYMAGVISYETATDAILAEFNAKIAKTATIRMLRALSFNTSAYVRCAVAENPKIDREIAIRLVNDDMASVRIAVAGNESCPLDLLGSLIEKETSRRVKPIAVNAMIKRMEKEKANPIKR